MNIRPLFGRFGMQVFSESALAGSNRTLFRCQPFEGVNHEMLAVYDRWLFCPDEGEQKVYRLNFIDFEYVGTTVRIVELQCTEVVIPPKERFVAMGLDFLEKKPQSKRRAKNRKHLILDDEI